MKKSYYLKNSETFMDDSDVGLLHQEGTTIGVIVELGTCSFNGFSFELADRLAARSNTASLVNKWDEVELGRFWALKVKDWVVPDEQENLIYPESGIEKEILSTGITSETSSLGIYILDLPSNIASSDPYTVSCHVKDIFWKKGLYIKIISKPQQKQANRKRNHRIIDP